MAFAPILIAVLAGLLIGVARRGRLRSIARTRVRHPELLALAVACSLVVDSTDAGPSALIALGGLAGGLGFAAVNLHLTGMAVIAVGIAANLLPIVANGSMPVRPEALVEAGMVDSSDLDRVELNGARELTDESTSLGFLGDTFPVRWTTQVVSIGDLIMIVGLADVITNLTLQRRRRRATMIDLREPDPGVIDLTADKAGAALGTPPPTAQPAASSSIASPAHD